MARCYACRERDDETGDRWQYVTLNEPCEDCDSDFSHELKFEGPRHG